MNRRRLAAAGSVLAAAAGLVLAAPADAQESPGQPGHASHAGDAVVRTDRGAVRGTLATDHRTFQGIPYAAAPIGDLRWRSPRPAAPWTGIRDATRRGDACAQTDGFLGDPASYTEDCLYLNVTTPRHAGNRPLPVMVFIHGGGFYSGSAALYGGEKLATQGDVIVVTPNYRLGVFGFLDHPALGRTAGNFGLQDQQAALRWVRRNAAAFGGDPDNVTLLGESAGGVSTCSHLVAPSSAGLFRRAIVQSGPCAETDEWPYLVDGNWFPRSRAVAEREGVAAATTLGCTDSRTAEACLRGKTTREVLSVSYGGQGFGPVYGDGALLPMEPRQALATGRFNRVPVMHGTTKDEHRTFVGAIELFKGGTPLTEQEYVDEARAVLGPREGDTALARYPLSRYGGSPSLAQSAMWTDRSWSCPALTTDRSLSRHVPTYAFEFADRTAPWTDANTPSFPTGAFHAGELQYLFDDEQFPGPATAAQRTLSAQMIRYWTRFAHTGDPNGPGTPQWPRFRGSSERVQSLGIGSHGIGPVELGREHQCGFWLSR